MAIVPFVTSWGVTGRGAVVAVVLALPAAGCGGADATSTTTSAAAPERTTTTSAPPRPVSPTTTIYDPATVEGQVEAAYLKSWEVYAAAVYDLRLDESALQSVYAGDHLDTKRTEIARRIAEGRAALVRIDHHYTVRMLDAVTAIVVDQLTNHQVLVDARTKAPREADPNAKLTDAVRLELVDGAWRVTRKDRLQ